MFQLTFNTYSALISLSLIIGLTFGLLLWFKRHQNKRADRFLAALMFIVVLWNASILILDLEIYRFAAGIIWVPMNFTLALGPCLFFYVRCVSDFEDNESLRIWPHFIPVFFEVLLFLIEVFQGLPQGKSYYQTKTFEIFDPVVAFLAIVSFMLYGYYARVRIQAYHVWVKNNYSHYHRYNLNWLMRLSSIFLYFVTIWLCLFYVDYVLFDYQLSFYDYYPFHLILAIISIWLSVEAFLKPDIVFSDHQLKSNKNKTALVTDKEIQNKAAWLTEKIEQNLLFLDPELSLKSLAKTLSMHPNVLSRIINDGLNQSFSDCINTYRVNAVVKKLKDINYAKTTFLALAFDSGFNSKTTFNRVFKKMIGQTPQQYRKNKPN